jgi:hypothetical protein
MSRTGMTEIVNLATCWVSKAAARAGKHVLDLCRTRRVPYEQTFTMEAVVDNLFVGNAFCDYRALASPAVPVSESGELLYN